MKKIIKARNSLWI